MLEPMLRTDSDGSIAAVTNTTIPLEDVLDLSSAFSLDAEIVNSACTTRVSCVFFTSCTQDHCLGAIVAKHQDTEI